MFQFILLSWNGSNSKKLFNFCTFISILYLLFNLYKLCKTRKAYFQNYIDKIKQFRRILSIDKKKPNWKKAQQGYNRSDRSRFINIHTYIYEYIIYIYYILYYFYAYLDHIYSSINCPYTLSMCFKNNIRNKIIFHKNQLKQDWKSVQMNRSSCSLSLSLPSSFPLSLSLSLSPSASLAVSISLCVYVLLRLLIEFNLPSLILHSPLCLSCLWAGLVRVCVCVYEINWANKFNLRAACEEQQQQQKSININNSLLIESYVWRCLYDLYVTPNNRARGRRRGGRRRRWRGRRWREGDTKAELSRTTTKQSAKIKLSIKIDFCCCFNEFSAIVVVVFVSAVWPEPENKKKKKNKLGREQKRRGEKRWRDEAEQHNTISINFKSHITSKQITKELICHQNHASAEIETDVDVVVDGNSDADYGEQWEDICEQRSAAEREKERERRGRCRD